jgi:hypothetical protein
VYARLCITRSAFSHGHHTLARIRPACAGCLAPPGHRSAQCSSPVLQLYLKSNWRTCCFEQRHKHVQGEAQAVKASTFMSALTAQLQASEAALADAKARISEAETELQAVRAERAEAREARERAAAALRGALARAADLVCAAAMCMIMRVTEDPLPALARSQK